MKLKNNFVYNFSSSYDLYSSLLCVIDNLAQLQKLNITSCTDALHFLFFIISLNLIVSQVFMVAVKDRMVLYMYIKITMVFVIIKTIHVFVLRRKIACLHF